MIEITFADLLGSFLALVNIAGTRLLHKLKKRTYPFVWFYFTILSKEVKFPYGKY